MWPQCRIHLPAERIPLSRRMCRGRKTGAHEDESSVSVAQLVGLVLRHPRILGEAEIELGTPRDGNYISQLFRIGRKHFLLPLAPNANAVNVPLAQKFDAMGFENVIWPRLDLMHPPFVMQEHDRRLVRDQFVGEMLIGLGAEQRLALPYDARRSAPDRLQGLLVSDDSAAPLGVERQGHDQLAVDLARQRFDRKEYGRNVVELHLALLPLQAALAPCGRHNGRPDRPRDNTAHPHTAGAEATSGRAVAMVRKIACAALAPASPSSFPSHSRRIFKVLRGSRAGTGVRFRANSCRHAANSAGEEARTTASPRSNT